MFKILSLLTVVVSARAASARTDIFFEAGARDGAAKVEGQSLNFGESVNQWNPVEADGEGALHHGVGETTIGSATDHVIAIFNGGDSAATDFGVSELTAPYSFKGGQYPGEGGTCGSELAAQSSCTLVVTHAPTDLGYYAGMVHVKFHDGEAEQSADLRLGGYGVAPASEESAAPAPTEAPSQTPSDEPKGE